MTKRKTVLILASTYPRWRGDDTPNFVADFARHIANGLDEVYVIAPHYKGAKRHEKNSNVRIKRIRYFFTAQGETIFYNGGGITKIKKSPLYALKLLGYLTSLFINTLYTTLRRDATLINAHWIIPQGFVAILVKLVVGRPVALTVHGADILSLNGKLMRRIKRFTLRHADIVYVNSSVTKEACEAVYQRDYILVPMGIDLAEYETAQASKDLKKRYNLTKFIIVFVGRLMEAKGVQYLLTAMKKLQETGRTATALIIGSGPLDDELHAYVGEHDLAASVVFTGWIDHALLPSYYASADVLVGPSLYEAQGLVFVEALAAGLPVITTNTGGARDFIKDGVNGYLVDPQSADQVFEKLALLYDDRQLLRQLKKQAPTSVREAFSWDTVTKSYLASWRPWL